MSLRTKQIIIAVLGLLFLVSLIFVQWMEVVRKQEEAGLIPPHVSAGKESRDCVECHAQTKNSPGIVDHWKNSRHAAKGIACYDCHMASEQDADHYEHYGYTIATIVTPRDCARCHEKEYQQFTNSHHAKAGNILASLDNILAEKVEGNREPFNPHSPTPGRKNIDMVNGMASVNTGCKQCHGARIALIGKDGTLITDEDLKPDPKTGLPTVEAAFENIKRDQDNGNRPTYASSTWPNTGIGRKNLDGSLGSCSACHSRHDFSPRRARQPENCGKCHLGPDHPQKEIYEESKHGIAFRDLKEHMNLNAVKWVLGEDYTQAPTCATCHMSANTVDRAVTHDPSERISWTNRPDVSAVMDTDRHGAVIKETDPLKRHELLKQVPEDELKVDQGERQPDTWQKKRERMQHVCTHCHTPKYVNAFYQQYDDFVVNYNEKFGKPGKAIMGALLKNGLRTKANFDEEIEWTWFYLWHHEGRRARHGASMMAPDYAHWHGMYEVAERFYMELIPQARELAHQGEERGNKQGAEAVMKLVDEILARPEHEWFQEQTKKLKAEGAADAAKVEAKSAP